MATSEDAEKARANIETFGFLNDLDGHQNPNKENYNSRVSFLDSLFINNQKVYKKDVLSDVNEFVGVCLTDVLSRPQTVLSTANDVLRDNIKGAYVRIPELHAHLPVPTGPKDYPVIRMYPFFVYEKNDEQVPATGALVFVRFGNKGNFSNPILIGPYSGNVSVKNPQERAIGTDSTRGQTMAELKSTTVTASDSLYYAKGANAKTREIGKPPMVELPKAFLSHNRKRKPSQIIIHESVTKTKEETFSTLLGKGAGVHYLVDTDGTIYHTFDDNKIVYHGNAFNDNSIGIEFQHRVKADEVILGKSIRAIWADGGIYLLPSRLQLQSLWKLVKWLSVHYDIPMAFPGVTNKRQQGQEHRDGRKRFSWTRVPGAETEPGIIAHKRIHHSDGCFQEHYILCMANNISDPYGMTIRMASLPETRAEQYTEVPE